MEDKWRILKLADQAAKDMDVAIGKMPKPCVWNCNSKAEIQALRQHFEEVKDDYRKRLPGIGNGGREMLMGLIESAERELREIEEVLEMLADK